MLTAWARPTWLTTVEDRGHENRRRERVSLISQPYRKQLQAFKKQREIGTEDGRAGWEEEGKGERMYEEKGWRRPRPKPRHMQKRIIRNDPDLGLHWEMPLLECKIQEGGDLPSLMCCFHTQGAQQTFMEWKNATLGLFYSDIKSKQRGSQNLHSEPVLTDACLNVTGY